MDDVYRVLLVDDEMLITQAMAKLLSSQSSYAVVATASNGFSALGALEETAADIVVADIRMPRMDGIQFLEEVRRRGIPTKVIMLSAYRDFEYARQALNLGACAYLLKPVSKEKLLASLEVAVSGLRRDREAEALRRLHEQGLAIRALLEKGERTAAIPKPFIREGRLGLMAAFCDESYPQPFLEDCTALGWHQCRETQLVFSFSKAEEDAALQALVKTTRKLANEYLLPDFIITASGGGYTSATLDGAYTECKLASVYYFYLSGFDLIHYQQVQAFGELPIRRVVDQFDVMKERMAFSTPPETLHELHTLYYMLKDGMYANVVSIRQLFCELLMQLNRLRSGRRGEDKAGQAERFDRTLRRFSTLDAVFAYVYSEFERFFDQRGDAAMENDDIIVEKTKAFCKNHYQEDCGLDDIAANSYISKSYLSQIFKEKTGVSIWNYFTNVRMEKAKELLAGGRSKATEVGELVGYHNPSHFGRIFKARVGVSPKEYQQAMAKR